MYNYAKRFYCNSLPITYKFRVMLLLVNVMFPGELCQ